MKCSVSLIESTDENHTCASSKIQEIAISFLIFGSPQTFSICPFINLRCTPVIPISSEPEKIGSYPQARSRRPPPQAAKTELYSYPCFYRFVYFKRSNLSHDIRLNCVEISVYQLFLFLRKLALPELMLNILDRSNRQQLIKHSLCFRIFSEKPINPQRVFENYC